MRTNEHANVDFVIVENWKKYESGLFTLRIEVHKPGVFRLINTLTRIAYQSKPPLEHLLIKFNVCFVV